MAIFFDFYRHHNESLLKTLPTSNASFLAADKGIINLNPTRQLLSARSDHSLSQFMKPCPSRLRTVQSQDLLQTGSANSRLLSADPPHGAEPHTKGLLGVLQDGSRRQRGLVVTTGAFDKIPFIGPSMVVPTGGTTKAIWPPLCKKIFSAGFFRSKSFVEFHQISRKIGKRVGFHSQILKGTLT
jgi:hypothetical protein